MARTPESSTERFPLDCRICTLVTVPFRKISNEITARGENVSVVTEPLSARPKGP